MERDRAPGALWDVIVIGAGLCGSVAADVLSRDGHRVLVLEAGQTPHSVGPGKRGLLARIRHKLLGSTLLYPGRWNGQMKVNLTTASGRKRNMRFPAFLGTGPGGGSLIYGAALGRFQRDDFTRNASEDPEAFDNSWPLDWAAFLPWYTAAEQLMQVHGSPDPTDPDDNGGALTPPPPLGPRDAAFADCLAANGRNPFRLRVGFQYRPGCSECLGIPCPRGCKSDGFSRCLGPALAAGRVTLRTKARVTGITDDGTTLTVQIKDETPDAPELSQQFCARHVVLAAGALQTPRLLHHAPDLFPDGRPSPLLGRGLMFHGADIFAVFDPEGRAEYGPRKTLGFRDHYRDQTAPLGEVQSVGLPITTGTVTGFLIDEAKRRGFSWMGRGLQLLRFPAMVGVRMFRNATLFATNLEDFPSPQNRVIVTAEDDEIAVAYQVSPDMARRGAALRAHIRAAFAPWRVIFLSTPDTPNWGHPTGTCRMGTDPETSVTTPDGQLWGNDRVTVLDTSVFPSSAGANPSLTAVANALRISCGLRARL